MLCCRTWKRDGTRNLMPVTTAARTLKERSPDRDVKGQPVEAIEARLRRGERLHTELAVYAADFAAGSG